MQTKTYTITEKEIDTTYNLTGNSSGMVIDTLAIAVGGHDYNDYIDNNYDYVADEESHARTYWLENSGQSYWLDTIVTRADIERYILDKHVQIVDFAEWCDNLPETNELPDNHPLAIAVQEDTDSKYDDLRRDWLFGDYYNNFKGILPLALKRYSEYGGIYFNYNDKKHQLIVNIGANVAKELKENGDIERATQKAVFKWLCHSINSDAYTSYGKSQAEVQKRRTEYQRVKEYKEKQAIAAEKSRVEKLQELITKK